MYEAKIIADSTNPVGDRLTTWELTYPRFVHAELMTHRMFSRNAASSRAIPTAKLMQRIEEHPGLPKWWGKNQSGMQAREELQGDDLERVKSLWLSGRDDALALAEQLHLGGLHKQIANRVLEPWMFITVIVSATEWGNWYHLRDDPNAQPEIAWVAREMRGLIEKSTPRELKVGEWHVPYVVTDDRAHPLYVDRRETGGSKGSERYWKFLVKVSTARCARVSYLTHDGVRDLGKDIELHDKLTESGHWSPFEHPAEADDGSGRHGNYFGWRQYRKQFKNENFGRKMQ